MIYDWEELKQILNDVKADPRTRRIARGLAKTSMKVACEYALLYPQRVQSERLGRKSYE